MHDQKDEDRTVRIPEIIQFYNATKGGVDCFDKLCHTYSVSRKTRRWPLCVFYGLLNAVGINSMVLLLGSESKTKECVPNRRTYLKKLAVDLIKPRSQVCPAIFKQLLQEFWAYQYSSNYLPRGMQLQADVTFVPNVRIVKAELVATLARNSYAQNIKSKYVQLVQQKDIDHSNGFFNVYFIPLYNEK